MQLTPRRGVSQPRSARAGRSLGHSGRPRGERLAGAPSPLGLDPSCQPQEEAHVHRMHDPARTPSLPRVSLSVVHAIAGAA